MAAKIRYLQEYKNDRDQMQIMLVKYRHQNEKLKKDYDRVRGELRDMQEKMEIMKRVMLDFDHQYIDEQTNENVSAHTQLINVVFDRITND